MTVSQPHSRMLELNSRRCRQRHSRVTLIDKPAMASSIEDFAVAESHARMKERDNSAFDVCRAIAQRFYDSGCLVKLLAE